MDDDQHDPPIPPQADDLCRRPRDSPRASQCSPKGEKTCPDSRPTRVQNFMPLSLSAADKSVTVQKMSDKQKKLRTVNQVPLHTTVWWG